MAAAASATPDPLATTTPATTYTQSRAATTQIVIRSCTIIGCYHVTAERRPQRRQTDNARRTPWVALELADAGAFQLAVGGGWHPADAGLNPKHTIHNHALGYRVCSKRGYLHI